MSNSYQHQISQNVDNHRILQFPAKVINIMTWKMLITTEFSTFLYALTLEERDFFLLMYIKLINLRFIFIGGEGELSRNKQRKNSKFIP